MLKVDFERWGQNLAQLRQSALAASHPRTRERFLALYDIAQGSNATLVAARIGRHFQSVQSWVHAYNERGPQALSFIRTGGRPPFVPTLNRH